MYIIERGRLNCVSDDGGEIYRVLEAGDVFGQLAILNLSGDISGNRREVALCAAAYTDIYSLHQDDAMEVLQDYPEERRKLIKRGRATAAPNTDFFVLCNVGAQMWFGCF